MNLERKKKKKYMSDKRYVPVKFTPTGNAVRSVTEFVDLRGAPLVGGSLERTKSLLVTDEKAFTSLNVYQVGHAMRIARSLVERMNTENDEAAPIYFTLRVGDGDHNGAGDTKTYALCTTLQEASNEDETTGLLPLETFRNRMAATFVPEKPKRHRCEVVMPRVLVRASVRRMKKVITENNLTQGGTSREDVLRLLDEVEERHNDLGQVGDF